MKIQPRRHRRDSEQSVMPLVNVVFLLLIFFMLTGRITIPDVLPIEPPLSSSRTFSGASDTVILLSADGQLAMEGKRIDAEELQKHIVERLTVDPATVVKLKADRRTDSYTVINVTEQLRDMGVKRLLLLTALPES